MNPFPHQKEPIPEARQRKTIHEFSAGGLVIKREENKIKYLLISDHNRKWTLPKGKIEKDENAIQAAQREIGEETGIRDLRLIKELEPIKYFYQRDNNLIFKIVRFFLFETKPKNIPKPDKKEIHDAKFFDIDEATQIAGYRNTKEILEKLKRGKQYGKPKKI